MHPSNHLFQSAQQKTTNASVMDVHLELYRSGVGRDTTTVNTICEPMKIDFVLMVLGSKVSSALNSLHFRIT